MPAAARRTFRHPTARGELPISILMGAAFSFGLFVLMALAQMMGTLRSPKDELYDNLIALTPPEIEEIAEPPPQPEEEPPPELMEEPPPQLSLDQLDIALNPGSGDSLMGDFSLPNLFGAGSKDLGTKAFLDFSDLDQRPRPVGVFGFNFPRRLRRKPASGKIVLMLQIDHQGKVLSSVVESSNLPAFDDFVASEVKRWKFTPPTKDGKPVQAQARLPIPINIR